MLTGPVRTGSSHPCPLSIAPGMLTGWNGGADGLLGTLVPLLFLTVRLSLRTFRHLLFKTELHLWWYCPSLETNESHRKEEYLSAKSRRVEPVSVRLVASRIQTLYPHRGQVRYQPGGELASRPFCCCHGQIDVLFRTRASNLRGSGPRAQGIKGSAGPANAPVNLRSMRRSF